MANFLMVEGPEKAGKSTFVEAIAKKTGAFVRHWGPIPDELDAWEIYSKTLREDISNHKWTVWDRGPVSAHVYDSLLSRNGRLGKEPEKIEESMGELIRLHGTIAIFLGPTVSSLLANRTPDDLKVHPEDERKAFQMFARTQGWPLFINLHDDTYVEHMSQAIIDFVNIRGCIDRARWTR